MNVISTRQQSSKSPLFKVALLFFSFFLSGQLLAQKVDKYIEVWERVNYLGSTRVEAVTYPEDKAGNPDSSVGVTKIEEIIKAARKNRKAAVWVINELSHEGWSLVSSVFVPGSEFNSGGTKYYLKKSFNQL